MVDKEIYIITFLVGTAIFVLGFYIGGVINQPRINEIKSQNDLLAIKLENINLGMKILESMNNSKMSCDYITEQLNEAEKERLKIVDELQRTEEIDEGKFDITKRKYTLSLVNIWLLSIERNKLCGRKYPTVLYFYSIGSEACREQGKILDHIVYLYRKRNETLTVLSFDKDFDMPIIKLLVNDLNVTQSPTIIIGNKRFVGLTSENKIMDYLCKNYNYC